MTIVDQSRLNRTKWTNLDRIRTKGTELDQIRTNGQIRTKVDIIDRIETNSTKQDQFGHIRPDSDPLDFLGYSTKYISLNLKHFLMI